MEEIKVWSVHFKDGDGEDVISHVFMTMEQAKELVEKFIEKEVEITLRDLTKLSSDESFGVLFEDDTKLFEEQ